MTVRCAWLACFVGACTPEHVVATPQPPPDPVAIIGRMATMYSQARSYSDRGNVSTEISKHGRVTQQARKIFQTAFVRDQTFRFEVRDDDDPKSAYVIWSDGTHTYSQWRAFPNVVDDGADLANAITAATGVSSRTTYTIPTMLLARTGVALTSLLELRVVNREPIDAHPCWHLDAVDRDDHVELWIDDHDALLQMRRRHHFGPQTPEIGELDVVELTSYAPVIDAPIAASLLQPPDLTGGVERRGQPAFLGVFPDPKSTHIIQVVRDSPADRAGIRLGDEIVSIDAHAVASAKEIVRNARALTIGATVPIVVRRGGTELTLSVVPEKRPSMDALQATLVGKPATDFTLPSATGGPALALGALAGHVVVIEFWATWCGPCAITAPHLDDWHHKYADLRIVGISDEDATTIQPFAIDHKLTYPLALDPDDHATRDYLVQGLPTLVVIDKTGVVRDVRIGVPDFDEVEALITKLMK